nr:unnamed protein product [Callosobruchus chinensis]
MGENTISSSQNFRQQRNCPNSGKNKPNCWRHVSSSGNPGDLLTRGVSPGQLSKSSLWFQVPGVKRGTHFPIGRVSNLTRLIRCVRFITNLKVSKDHRILTDLTSNDLRSALSSIIKQVHGKYFYTDINYLSQNGSV